MLQRTAGRIRTFAEAQRKALVDTTVNIPGGKAGHTVTPVNTAGCYAPGGRYPLPSSVLMTGMMPSSTNFCFHTHLCMPTKKVIPLNLISLLSLLPTHKFSFTLQFKLLLRALLGCRTCGLHLHVPHRPLSPLRSSLARMASRL